MSDHSPTSPAANRSLISILLPSCSPAERSVQTTRILELFGINKECLAMGRSILSSFGISEENEDGFYNVTDICSTLNQKWRPHEIVASQKLQAMQNSCKQLLSLAGMPGLPEQLVYCVKTSDTKTTGKRAGTYVHWSLMTYFFGWVSPEFDALMHLLMLNKMGELSHRLHMAEQRLANVMMVPDHIDQLFQIKSKLVDSLEKNCQLNARYIDLQTKTMELNSSYQHERFKVQQLQSADESVQRQLEDTQRKLREAQQVIQEKDRFMKDKQSLIDFSNGQIKTLSEEVTNLKRQLDDTRRCTAIEIEESDDEEIDFFAAGGPRWVKKHKARHC